MEEGKLIYEDLSYRIRGLIYKVHTEIGRYKNEKQYCDSLEDRLKKENIQYEREKILEPTFDGEKKGRSRLDFLIEDKIILEIKNVPSFTPQVYQQCERYLVCADKKLLLLVNYYYKQTSIKRILNPTYSKNTP